jgi:hypothetical protein
MNIYVVAVALSLLCAACSGWEPYQPPEPGSPPTEDEMRILGGDVGDREFLERWRKCTRYASDTSCYREFYGGGGPPI